MSIGCGKTRSFVRHSWHGPNTARLGAPLERFGLLALFLSTFVRTSSLYYFNLNYTLYISNILKNVLKLSILQLLGLPLFLLIFPGLTRNSLQAFLSLSLAWRRLLAQSSISFSTELRFNVSA